MLLRRLILGAPALALGCSITFETTLATDTLPDTTTTSTTTSGATDTDPTGSGGTTASETTGAATATTGSSGAVTEAPPTTGDATAATTDGETTATTVAETAATTVAETFAETFAETTDGTTGAPATTEYAAFYVPGGLDRLVVRKADLTNDRCTSLVLVWPNPQQPEGFAIDLQDEWGVQAASIAEGTAGCLEFMGLMPGVDAEAGTGSVSWAGGLPGPCPPTIAVDVLLAFPAGQPWVPAGDLLQNDAVPLQGC